ncbi:hypothetical protein LguiA_004646 [Lonicera macranthoides]
MTGMEEREAHCKWKRMRNMIMMMIDYAQKVRSITPKCKQSSYNILGKVQGRTTDSLTPPPSSAILLFLQHLSAGRFDRKPFAEVNPFADQVKEIKTKRKSGEDGSSRTIENDRLTQVFGKDIKGRLRGVGSHISKKKMVIVEIEKAKGVAKNKEKTKDDAFKDEVMAFVQSQMQTINADFKSDLMLSMQNLLQSFMNGAKESSPPVVVTHRRPLRVRTAEGMAARGVQTAEGIVEMCEAGLWSGTVNYQSAGVGVGRWSQDLLLNCEVHQATRWGFATHTAQSAPLLKVKLNDLNSSRKELEEELQKLEHTNQTLMLEECASKHELEDARKEAVDLKAKLKDLSSQRSEYKSALKASEEELQHLESTNCTLILKERE